MSMVDTQKYSLGIELGSTRIKALVIDSSGEVVTNSSYGWKSELKNGLWTYDLSDVDKALDALIKDLDFSLEKISAMGVSAMMHGYLAFDKDDNLLTPFRTWQNTNTSVAAKKLSKLFEFNIPERWSIAHLYQAILDNETHISEIAYITTLAGWVHYKLTGEKIIGIGDASGMFPVNSNTKEFNEIYIEKFNDLLSEKGIKIKLENILPEIKLATEFGGKHKDYPNISFCPPEGDAGTGMIATNSIRKRTGNVSAGTSVFAMVVLEKSLKSYYEEVDIVTTPLGDEVAMIHANNCTLDLNAWVSVFGQLLEAYNIEADDQKLYNVLFKMALEGERSGGGLINYPFVTGEPIAKIEAGSPVFVRELDANFNLENFMRAYLMSCLAALKIGFDLLRENENLQVDKLVGHGGYFAVENVGQKIMAAALGSEIGVMENANEGGAWGMAILAAAALYNAEEKNIDREKFLQEYLDDVIFVDQRVSSVAASKADLDGFNKYIEKFKKYLASVQTIGNK